MINGDNLYIVEEFPRSFLIETSGKSFKTPFFVPAVSSLVKTNLKILEYIDLLKKVGYPGFLISAYDIDRLQNKEEKVLLEDFSDFAEKRKLIFLDNGNYEAYWYSDQKWILKNLERVLEKISPDFCFSFDIFWDENKNVEKYIKETITSIAKTAGIQKTGETIALIHSNPKLFPKVARKIVDYINPEIIAIPERELGPSIFERSQTIKAVRDELNKTEKPIAIHVLGTGHPVSILIYTLCGADIYDAYTWYSECINPETGHFLHFSQRDLVDCHCEACKLEKVPYNFQTMTHNLMFYLDFLDKIREAIRNESIEKILAEYIRKKDVSIVKKIGGLDE